MKKTKKRILSFALSLMMAVMCFMTAATGFIATAAVQIFFTIRTVEAAPGTNVSVPVFVYSSEYIQSMKNASVTVEGNIQPIGVTD
jgi:hypothetical protein